MGSKEEDSNFQNESILFEPYQEIGYFTDNVPLSSSFGTGEKFTNLIYASIGHSFNCYTAEPSFAIQFSGPQFKNKITQLLTHRVNVMPEAGFQENKLMDFVLVATGTDIVKVNQREILSIFRGHTKQIVGMIQIGEYLVSVGKDKKLILWPLFPKKKKFVEVSTEESDSKNNKIEKESLFIDPISIQSLPADCTPTCLIHPKLYIDKVLIGTEEGKLELWNIKFGKSIYSFGPFGSAISTIIDSGALDKVIFGTSEGQIFVFDLLSDETLCTFTHAAENEEKTGITCLSINSPLFLESGEDSSSSELQGLGMGNILISGNGTGSLAVWCLKTRKLRMSTQIHTKGFAVRSLLFLPNGKQLITSGDDNAIHKFSLVYELNSAANVKSNTESDIDKGAEGIQKLSYMDSLSGHSATPHIVRFYGDRGNFVVTAGGDSQLRTFSLLSARSRVLSQKAAQSMGVSKTGKEIKGTEKFQKEYLLPKVTGFDINTFREDDWCNMVTSHLGTGTFYLWNVKRGKLGFDNNSPIECFRPAAEYGTIASCCVSICGNSIICGRSNGLIEKWSIQSGMFKQFFNEENKFQMDSTTQKLLNSGNSSTSLQTFDDMKKKKVQLSEELQPLKAFGSSVVGVCVDNTNTFIVGIGFKDNELKWWSFESGKFLGKINLIPAEQLKNNGEEIFVTKIRKSPTSNMLAIAFSDQSIRIVSLSSMKIFRIFEKNDEDDNKTVLHTQPINDLAFSYDGRQLISCSMDCSIIVYDLMSAEVIDWFKFEKPAVSVDFHPEGLYFVSSHLGELGVCLWANKKRFNASNVFLQSYPFEGPIPLQLPLSGEIVVAAVSKQDKKKENEKLDFDFQEEERKQILNTKISKDFVEFQKLKKRKRGNFENEEEKELFEMLNETSHEASEHEIERKRRKLAELFGVKADDEKKEGENNQIRSKNQEISDKEIFLSGKPEHFWFSIACLNKIRSQLDRLDEKKVVSATPFFLETESNVSNNVLFTGEKKKEKNEDNEMEIEKGEGILSVLKQKSKILSGLSSSSSVNWASIRTSELTQKIEKWFSIHQKNESGTGSKKASKEELEAFWDILMLLNNNLSVKEIDSSIRIMSYDRCLLELQLFLSFLVEMLEMNLDFDMIQAMLYLFLEVHGEAIKNFADSSREEADKDIEEQRKRLFLLLSEVKNQQKQQWEKVEHLFSYCVSLVKYFSNMNA